MSIERRYIDLFKYDLPGELPAIQKRYRERANQDPRDPAALYLAGIALQSYDTPEAIRLLETAKKLDAACHQRPVGFGLSIRRNWILDRQGKWQRGDDRIQFHERRPRWRHAGQAGVRPRIATGF